MKITLELIPVSERLPEIELWEALVFYGPNDCRLLGRGSGAWDFLKDEMEMGAIAWAELPKLTEDQVAELAGKQEDPDAESRMLKALEIIAKMDTWTSGELRGYARKAIERERDDRE